MGILIVFSILGSMMRAFLCIFLIFCVWSVQSTKCRPNIEIDTPGIDYEKITELYMNARKVYEQAEETQLKAQQLDRAIKESYNGGLDSIITAIRDLGLELVPEAVLKGTAKEIM